MMSMQDPNRTTDFPCKRRDMVCPNMDSHLPEEEDRRFKCDECGRGYRHAGSLANHKKTHEVGSFQCDICGKENSNALSLKSHLRSHTSQKKYSCAECGKSFRLATQLATHQRVHLSRRVKEHSFKKLHAEYPAGDSVNETENNHPYLSEHSNSVGNSTVNSPSEDKADVVFHPHIDSCEEAGSRPFRCDLCDKSYLHPQSLTNHKKTHQVGVFECSVCLKQFHNMSALYSHQRSHRGRLGPDPGSVGGPYATETQQSEFLPKIQEVPGLFCHLCQVPFSGEEEFQAHIQMHNSSSASFGPDSLSEGHSASYDNSISSPESNFYPPPISHIPPLSSLSNVGFHHPHDQVVANGHLYFEASVNQTPLSSITQGDPPITGMNSSNLLADQDNAGEIEETSTVDSDERPFKCQTCGKSYRHSGSLINHKRSHQVGIYQCSICQKNYPHLAALKSHLRLHKAQPSSFGLNVPEGDWLSSEPLTLDHHHHQQQGSFSSSPQEEEPQSGFGIDLKNEINRGGGPLYQDQYGQDFPQQMTVNLPQNEHLMQRHMCADCGETFADIAGIKSHVCLLLQQQDSASNVHQNLELNVNYQNRKCLLLQDDAGHPESNAEFHGPNSRDEGFLSEDFGENIVNHPLNGDGAGDNTEEDEEEEDDGDLYQCSICGNGYTSKRALRSHLRGHTQDNNTPVSSEPSSMSPPEDVTDDAPGEMMICSTCGESFANRLDLVSHQLLHNQDQVNDGKDSEMEQNDVSEGKGGAESIICGSCGIFCTSYHHLETHGCKANVKEQFTDIKEEIGVEDVDQIEDNRSVKEAGDSKDRQYRCDQCGRSYRHAGSLLNHKKSHKTGVYRCLICQKKFYNLLASKNHQRSHFDIKRHSCQECGKSFKIQKQLLNHLRRHKENQAKIQELNNQIQALMQMNGTKTESSNSNQTLGSRQRHKQESDEDEMKHPVKSEDAGEDRPFACDQCGRTYRHAGSLVNHRNSHKTGEYYCSVCNNTYSNQLAMKNHMRTHFGLKKHLCQNCGKGFRGKKQLLVHVCSALRHDGSKRRRGLKSKECKKTLGDAPSNCNETDSSSDKEERPFTCNICNRSYRHAGSLLNHKNTHKTGHFSCTFCSKPFTNPMALRNHTRIHTQKKKFVCLTCGKAFRLASILHNHQKVHNRVAGHFSCHVCGKSFQGRSGLKRHRCRRGQGSSTRTGLEQTDGGDKCFTCDLCGRSYRHAGSLLNHKKTHSENLHHCSLCLQSFPDSVSLQIHSGMRRHCCPECGKTFCLLAHLQSHMEVHVKEKSVVCSLCQQSVPSGDGYQQHLDRHHREDTVNNHCWDSGMNGNMGVEGIHRQIEPPSHISGDSTDSHKDTEAAEEKSHVCEHCGRTYRHAGSLLNHKNSHKTGSFFCSVCQKEFTNLMALKNHRRIHTEPKRYQCLECGKAFRVSTQLICHRRIHTKEKPFSCSLCDKSFSSKSNLRHHQKLHQNSHKYDSSFSIDADAFMDLDMGSFL